MRTRAIVAPYGGIHPQLAKPPPVMAPGATLAGRITLGGGAWLGMNAVVRADGHYVEIGADFCLGPDATVHIAHDLYPTRIGSEVTVEQGAVVHACDVGNGCVIGPGAVILDGSRLADGVVIAPAAVVYPRSTLEGGWLYEGMPAKPARRLEPGELQRLHEGARRRIRAATSRATVATADTDTATHPKALFLAPNATVSGRFHLAADVGIWYGCTLHTGTYVLTVGTRTNIQDNSAILCQDRDVVIGADTTIGHNVEMVDAHVGAHCLIGIGARLAPGTVVEDDVLLAAGAETRPGQKVTAGALWAGRPARRVADLDDRKRSMMAEIIPIYCGYALSARREFD